MENIRYKKEFTVTEDNSGTRMRIPVYSYKEVESDYIKQYRNCLANLCRLGTLATRYILFIVDEMDKNNIYRNDVTNKEKFIQRMFELGHEHHIKSLDSIIEELIGVGFITRQRRSVYEVNPEFFWKDNEANRVDKIKLSLEFNYNEKVKIDIERYGN